MKLHIDTGGVRARIARIQAIHGEPASAGQLGENVEPRASAQLANAQQASAQQASAQWGCTHALAHYAHHSTRIHHTLRRQLETHTADILAFIEHVETQDITTGGHIASITTWQTHE